MGNLGSIDSGLINRDNSTVSVGNKSMGISSSIRIGSIGISGIPSGDDVSKLSKMHSPSIGISGIPSGDDVSKLSKMHSPSIGDLGCVSGDNSSVGVGHQSGGGDGHTGSKNQKLHVVGCGVFCARVQT